MFAILSEEFERVGTTALCFASRSAAVSHAKRSHAKMVWAQSFGEPLYICNSLNVYAFVVCFSTKIFQFLTQPLVKLLCSRVGIPVVYTTHP